MRNLFILICMCSFFVVFGQKRKYQRTTVGIKDHVIAKKIRHINEIINLLNKNDYAEVERKLKNKIEQTRISDFEKQHLRNVLADIYTYHLLDIEKAIEIDNIIQSNYRNVSDDGSYRLNETSAHDNDGSVSLISVSYRDKYVNISSKKIEESSSRRKRSNTNLLKGEKPKSSTSKDEYFFLNNLKLIKSDLSASYKGTKDYEKLLSRAMRFEYEAYLFNKNYNYFEAYKSFLNNEMDASKIFYKEISFLKLSKYLEVSYKKSKNPEILEYALVVLNRPYLNLKNKESKRAYSALVNKIIDDLIDAYYERNEYWNCLYYISLNKSRVLAEENLRNLKADLSSKKSIDAAKQKFKSINSRDNHFINSQFIDIYTQNLISKSEGSEKTDDADEISSLAAIDDNFVGGLTRGMFNESNSKIQYKQKIKAFYISKIAANTIKVHKINNIDKIRIPATDMLKRFKDYNINISEEKRSLVNNFGFNEIIDFHKEIYLSVDGRLSQLPFSYLFDKPVVRTLNVFTYSKRMSTINNVKILGLFNPTLDLCGAEKEFDVIKQYFPDSSTYLFKNKSATKAKLKSYDYSDANIVHISTHGNYNSTSFDSTILAFAHIKMDKECEEMRGMHNLDEKVDKKKDDKTKNIFGSDYIKNNFVEHLSVKEIKENKYPGLWKKDLIFLGACHVGLSDGDPKNLLEVEGLIRPLLKFNNSNIITALWAVPDKETLEWVGYFYEKLSASKNVANAYKYAVTEMKKNYPNQAHAWAGLYLMSVGDNTVR